MRKLIILPALLTLISAPALAGPFGIDIGQDVSTFDISDSNETSGIYVLARPPAAHPSFIDYAVTASPNEGACLVRALTRDYDNDPAGTSVRAEFSRIRGQLNAAYGESSLFDFLPSSSYLTAMNDWTRGIYRGERHYQATWGSPTGENLRDGVVEVLLTVVAYRPTSGLIDIQYRFSNYTECRQDLDGIGASVL